ncbi:uncharacterized protein [Ptychodera flava]|uniref:uncharacterized protein n=1 Tax=Ptychodera flava TaxID=63121 RepID=UPI00396A8244
MRLLINGEVLSVAGTISAYRINTLTNNMFDTSTMYLVTLDTAESSDNESDGNVRRPIQRVVWQDDEGNFTVDGRDSSTYEVRGVERSPVTLTSSPRRSSTGGSALFESTANSSTNRADLGLGTSYQVPRPIGVRPPGVSQQQPEQRRKVINKAVTVISYTSAGYRDENMVILTLDENECSLENFCMKVKSINNWEEDTILILDRSQTPISESPATSGPDFWRTPRKLFAVRDEDYKKFIYKEKAPKRKSELQNVESDLKIIKQHIGEMRGLQGVFSRPRDPLTCMVCLERASFPLYACFKCIK